MMNDKISKQQGKCIFGTMLLGIAYMTIIGLATVMGVAALSGVAKAGTDKDTGEVCQGSTCNGGSGGGSVGDVSNTNNNDIVNRNSNDNVNRNSNDNVNRNSNSATSSATGGAGGNAKATGGNAKATGGNSSASSGDSSSSSSVTVNNNNGNGKNTPSMSAPALSNTASCTVSWSSGVSVPGLGLSGGGSYTDEQCTFRNEFVLLYNAIGEDAAILHACKDGGKMAATLSEMGLCPTEQSVEQVASAKGFKYICDGYAGNDEIIAHRVCGVEL